MKKFLLILLLLLAAGGAWWYFRVKKEDKPVVLATEAPHYGYISKSVTATGTVQPVDTVTVGSQVSGTIQYLYTDFNAKVKKGQLIAQLDKSLFQAQVDQYQANLEQAKASLVYEKSTFDRQSLLYKTGAISKADYENAENQYLSAKATVGSVQAQLNASAKNLSYASIYSPVDGVVMTRNVSIGQTVAASFNTPTLFVIAKDISRMQVQAAVSEADIGDVRVGEKATFTVDAYPDITFVGTVNQIRLEPVVSANVVTYTTILTAHNEDLKLKPGMTANIFVYIQEEKNALLIPSKALKFQPDATLEKQYVIRPWVRGTHTGERSDSTKSDSAKSEAAGTAAHNARPTDSAGYEIDTSSRKNKSGFVWVLAGDTLVEHRIHTGLNDDTHVQVLSGLSVTDSVVTGIADIPVKGSSSGTTGAARSPFMPARRNSGSRSSGGAGGGGGNGAGGARGGGGAH